MLAALAMISCGNTYTAQQVTLNTMNDSINYALGLINGAQIKMYQLRGDSSEATITEFIDALQRGYDGKVEELSETENIAQNIGQMIKANEKKGLADNEAWTLNEKILFQGLVNGLYGNSEVMEADVAREFFQTQYQASRTSEEKAGKAITAKCTTKTKTIELKTLNDSLNYAFGYFNGTDIHHYVLSSDSTGKDTKAFIDRINKSMKNSYNNPQLVNMGEQIGKTIKDQEATGLIGEPSLATDFALIKQGFINGLKEYEEQMSAQEAGEYIQTAMDKIKYGDTKEQGEAFLAENALKDGVITTESGLQYEVLKMGKGKKPSETDRVKVHYHGTLIDGTVFDSSVERGEPIVFGLNQVIKGWTEGVQLMPVGSKFRFYIPQELGYGSRAAGSIPPYSTLIFEVELLGIE